MKYSLLTLTTIIICFFVGTRLFGQEAGSGDFVLARVNEKVITRRDLNKLLTMTGEDERIARNYHGVLFEKEMQDACMRALAFLIDEAVVEVNAELEEVEIDEIDREKAETVLKENIEPFGTRANYESILKERELTLDDIKTRIFKTLLRQKYIQSKLPAKDFIPPRETRDYYEKNKPSFAKRETVSYRQIVIKFGGNNRRREEALKLIAGLKAKLEEGADFDSLARQFSEGIKKENGGLWPPVALSDLRRNIAEAISGMKEKEISKIIERDDAFLLMKLETKDSSPYEPFEKALEGIRKLLNEQNREGRLPDLEKKLYGAVEIELFYKGAKLEELCPSYRQTGRDNHEDEKRNAP